MGKQIIKIKYIIIYFRWIVSDVDAYANALITDALSLKVFCYCLSVKIIITAELYMCRRKCGA